MCEKFELKFNLNHTMQFKINNYRSLLIENIVTKEIFIHIGYSLFETLIALFIGTGLGIIIAILLWFSSYFAQKYPKYIAYFFLFCIYISEKVCYNIRWRKPVEILFYLKEVKKWKRNLSWKPRPATFT